MGVYVFKEDRPGRTTERLRMAWFHLEYFNVWNDPDTPNSLIQAPVGHGKSVSSRIQMAYDIGHQPEVRNLFITDVMDKARKTVTVMKTALKSGRYRALFPDVRVLTRMDNAEDSSRRFTVCRKNSLSREPTFEAAAITSRIQGNRYDHIWGDDPCPEDARYHASVREQACGRWTSVVESRIADPKTARIRMICTPWHQEDIAGKIRIGVETGGLKNWRVEIDRFRIKDDSKGKAIPLWPTEWNREYLEDQKVRDPDAYQYRYALSAANARDVIISKVYYYNADPQCPNVTPADKLIQSAIEQGDRWLSVDPAGTAAKHSSDTGIVDITMTANGFPFVTDCWFVHAESLDVIDFIADLIRAASPRYHGMQWEAQGGVKVGMAAIISTLIRVLKDGDAKRGIPPYEGWEELKQNVVLTGTMVGGQIQNRNKVVRLTNCAGIIGKGWIRFAGTRKVNLTSSTDGAVNTYLDAKGGTNIDQLINYVLNFDGSRGSDGVDALTQWVLRNRDTIKDPWQIAKPEAPVVKPLDAMTTAFQLQLEAMRRKKQETPYSDEEEFTRCRFGVHERNVA